MVVLIDYSTGQKIDVPDDVRRAIGEIGGEPPAGERWFHSQLL